MRQTVGIGGGLIIEEFWTFAMMSHLTAADALRHYYSERLVYGAIPLDGREI